MKGLTELVFVLDRSGSMSGLEEDTVGGFNALLRQQAEEEGEVLISTVLFNQESTVLYDRVKLSEIRPMTPQDFRVGGCTALMDAIGGAIHHIGNIHKYARPEDVPEKTLFVIMTDGLENASRRYSSDRVKRMIEERKREQSWEFLFMGANIDAVETAKHFGIDEARAVDYLADSTGTGVAYGAVAKAVRQLRGNCRISADWKAEIRADYEARK